VQINFNYIREVLVKGNSVSLRLSASIDNLIKGKVEESHFALELKSAVFGQIRKMDFPYFSLSRDSFHV
jgi:hypothetical protein